MKVLIVEDDFSSRKIMLNFLSPFGECDVAIDGREAVSAFIEAYEQGAPYNLVCLDIMMPEMDGHAVLKQMRAYEEEKNLDEKRAAKVVMTTALDDSSNVLGAFKSGCGAYIVKPIDKQRLLQEIRKLGLIE